VSAAGRTLRPLLAAGLGLAAVPLAAEPMLLSRQYNRCTSCHYSPTGGGLLTPYGRSLTRQELSTTGRSAGGAAAAAATRPSGEEAFLFGALGDALGPVDLELNTRPSHLRIEGPGFTSDRDFFMNADLEAGWRAHGWTVYGEIGRQPLSTSTRVDSYAYWVSHETDKGLGFRVGRFMPAYGVQFADHTAFNRAGLGFDFLDQLLALELSLNREKQLLQVALSPGRAESLLHGNDDGLRAFTGTARLQLDTSTRSALVFSGLYRASSRQLPENGGGGIAFGFSPARRVSIWTEGDVQFQHGHGAPAYVLVNETAFEVYRGVWLKVSPQLHTAFGDPGGGSWRLLLEAELFPRTHWNVDVSYYRDESRSSSIVNKTLLAQLHLYL
jgi:hypothetical protein